MKQFFLFVLILFTIYTSSGQGVFCLGPKIGYNSNTLTTNFDSIHSSINNSMQIGAFVRLGSKVYIQPEANYQVESGTLNQTLGASLLKQEFTVQTIKVPVLLGVKLINKSRFNLRLLAGPAVSFAVNKELNPSEMGDLWPIQSVDDLESSVWSMQMGGGVDLFFLTLDVRYELGIDNIYKGMEDVSMKNNAFNVSLGIKFL